MLPLPKKTNTQPEPETPRRGHAKLNSRGWGFGSTPPKQPKYMNPATPNFEPKAGSNGIRCSPYPAAVAAGCTYSNPLTLMHESVQRLERELAAQKMATKGDLAQMQREFAAAKQELATRDDLGSAKLSVLFEATDLKDEIRQNRENLAVLRDVVKNDLGTMYEMLKSVQGTTARLETESISMLVQGQGQRLEIEALPGIKMIEAAPSMEVATCTDAKEQQQSDQTATNKTPGLVLNKATNNHSKPAVASRMEGPEKSNGWSRSSQPTTTTVSKNVKIASEAPVKATKVPAPQTWLPHTLRQLKPTEIAVPHTHRYTFTFEYLHEHLGGSQRSPGLVFSNPLSLLRGRAYWLLEAVYEPFAPVTPGVHGAKLTSFFNDEITGEDCTEVPVFVSTGKQLSDYTYMGQYSQPRYSDRLSYSEMMEHVPSRVLRYWNENLADEHRPEWLTMQLMEHLSPRPAFTELSEWERSAMTQVKALTEADIAALWEKADADQPKGLRLWWEYLQCVGYDKGFYKGLVELGCGQKDEGEVVSDVEAQVEGANEVDGKEVIVANKKQSDEGVKMGENGNVKEAEQKAIEVETPFNYESTFTPRKKRTKRD